MFKTCSMTSPSYKQQRSEYFLGSIVTTNNQSPRAEVVDGQQRLAGTILLAAIRDHFYLSQDFERASTISPIC
jgi:uncharacterized protein with ParB-like and HNH nuclease domain